MKRKYGKNTLKYRILSLLILSAFALDLFICLVCGYTYTKNIKDEYNHLSSSIVNTVASIICEHDIEMWLSGEKNAGYDETLEKLTAIKKSALDMEALQVYRMNQNDMTVIFDIGNRTIGENVAYTKSLEGIKNKLILGENVGAFYLNEPAQIINYAPIKCKQTSTYAICKINMSNISSERNDFVLNIFFITTLTSIVLIIIFNIYLNHILIDPLNNFGAKLKKFADDNTTGEEIKEELKKIKHHNIKEIDEMRDDFMSLCDDIGIKKNEIKELDKKIMDKMQVVLKEFEDDELNQK